jgi:uncharacterized membrane protein
MMLKRSRLPISARPDADAPRLAFRLFWLCIPIGIIAAIVILLLFGLAWWSAVAIAFLIACPLVVAGVIVAEHVLPSSRRDR